jgi:hypothetical protein
MSTVAFSRSPVSWAVGLASSETHTERQTDRRTDGRREQQHLGAQHCLGVAGRTPSSESYGQWLGIAQHGPN